MLEICNWNSGYSVLLYFALHLDVKPGQKERERERERAAVMRRDDAIAITGQTISETSTVRQPQYASTSLPACTTFLATGWRAFPVTKSVTTAVRVSCPDISVRCRSAGTQCQIFRGVSVSTRGRTRCWFPAFACPLSPISTWLRYFFLRLSYRFGDFANVGRRKQKNFARGVLGLFSPRNKLKIIAGILVPCTSRILCPRIPIFSPVLSTFKQNRLTNLLLVNNFYPVMSSWSLVTVRNQLPAKVVNGMMLKSRCMNTFWILVTCICFVRKTWSAALIYGTAIGLFLGRGQGLCWFIRTTDLVCVKTGRSAYLKVMSVRIWVACHKSYGILLDEIPRKYKTSSWQAMSTICPRIEARKSSKLMEKETGECSSIFHRLKHRQH